MRCAPPTEATACVGRGTAHMAPWPTMELPTYPTPAHLDPHPPQPATAAGSGSGSLNEIGRGECLPFRLKMVLAKLVRQMVIKASLVGLDEWISLNLILFFVFCFLEYSSSQLSIT